MFNKVLILSAISLFSLNLHADEVKKNHPCQNIKTACESAGFAKGNHKDKKGLYKDCLNPLLEGKEVAGVTVAKEDISSCKEKKIERKEKKEAKK